jgi:hypothetical protein
VAAAVKAPGGHGRIAGFGVPFRPEDERAVHLTRLLQGHPGRRAAVAVHPRSRRLSGPDDRPATVCRWPLSLDLGIAPRWACSSA